jgi:hypothetical protein
MPLDRDNRPVAFSRADAMRLKRMLQAFERGFQNETPQRPAPRGRGPSVRRAVLTSSLTARAGSTPGTGTAHLRTFNGTTTSDLTESITVRSDFSTLIASGKVITIVNTDGAWWIISADC